MRRRFDVHDVLHRETCFKKGNKCRSALPIMPCNESFILDKDRAHKLFESVMDEDNTRDMIGQFKTVKWHYLDGTVIEKTPYSVVPGCPTGCEYIDQHSEPV